MMDYNQILPIQANYLFITFCFISDGRPGKEGERKKKKKNQSIFFPTLKPQSARK